MPEYHERLKELNKTEDKTILDSIDRPIRPLIIQLNRVGLRTRFSCCGFPYREEEEPKSHAYFPFVVLECPLQGNSNQKAAIEAFFSLSRALPGGWTLEPYKAGQWYLSGEKLAKQQEPFYRKEENEPLGIHDYEYFVITIQRLTKTLAQFPSAAGEFSVIDGNTNYEGMTGGEWQVDPKDTVVIQSNARIPVTGCYVYTCHNCDGLTIIELPYPVKRGKMCCPICGYQWHTLEGEFNA